MPALGTRQPIKIQVLDYSNERETIQNLYSGEITAVSLPGFLTQLSALETALDAVLLGVRAKSSWGAETVHTNTRPTDKDAQIETQMLVYLQDATTEQPFSFRIPAVDYTAFNYADPPAADSVIIAGAGATAATTALVTAIQAIAKSPFNDANGVEVLGMKVVR